MREKEGGNEKEQRLAWVALTELVRSKGNIPWEEFRLDIRAIAHDKGAYDQISPQDVIQFRRNAHLYNAAHALQRLRSDEIVNRKKVQGILLWHLRQIKATLFAIRTTEEELRTLVAKKGSPPQPQEVNEKNAQSYFMRLVTTDWNKFADKQLVNYTSPVAAYLRQDEQPVEVFCARWYAQYRLATFAASDHNRKRFRTMNEVLTEYRRLYTAYNYLLPDNIRSVLAPTP